MDESRGKHAKNPQISMIDSKIERYVEDVIFNLFKGYEGRIRVTEEDERVAREVITTIATLEAYHKLNDEELRGDSRINSSLRRIRLLANIEYLKTSLDDKICGYGMDYAKTECKSKEDLTDPKMIAAAYAKKMLRTLTLETYFRDLNDYNYILNKLIKSFHEILRNNGSISESFDIEGVLFTQIVEQAKIQKQTYREIVERREIENPNYYKNMYRHAGDDVEESTYEGKHAKKSPSKIIEYIPEAKDSNVRYLNSYREGSGAIIYPKEWQNKGIPQNLAEEFDEKVAEKDEEQNEKTSLRVISSFAKDKKSKEEDKKFYRFERDYLKTSDKMLKFIDISQCRGIKKSKNSEELLMKNLMEILIKAKYLQQRLESKELRQSLATSLAECINEIKLNQGFNHFTKEQCLDLIDKAAETVQRELGSKNDASIIVVPDSRKEGKIGRDNVAKFAEAAAIVAAIGVTVIGILNEFNGLQNPVVEQSVVVGSVSAVATAGVSLYDFISKFRKTKLRTFLPDLSEEDKEKLDQMIERELIGCQAIQKRMGYRNPNPDIFN